MSVEPGIAPVVDRALSDGVDWTAYRRCPTCDAETGEPCTSMFSAVVQGRPAGGPRALTHAHGFRKYRRGR